MVVAKHDLSTVVDVKALGIESITSGKMRVVPLVHQNQLAANVHTLIP
jgi:hypothetical protein